MPHARSIALLSTALIVLFGATFGSVAYAASVKDPSKIYFGTATKIEKPATITARKCFEKISHYKQIQDEGLKPGDPKYHLLLEKATKVFRRAVGTVARTKKVDLVCETGYLTLDTGETAADITAVVAKHLEGK